MAEKSRKLRITREAQGTSWMKMALNLVIMMTIGQDDGEGDYEDASEPGDQVVNQNQYVNHGDRHIPVTGVLNAMAEGLTSNKPRPGRRSATINAASVLFLVLW